MDNGEIRVVVRTRDRKTVVDVLCSRRTRKGNIRRWFMEHAFEMARQYLVEVEEIEDIQERKEDGCEDQARVHDAAA